MKDFSLFDIADFVMDEDFIRWVHQRSKEDDVHWENWLQRNPHKHLMVAEARRILESIGSEEPGLAPSVIDAEIEKLLAAINVREASTDTDEPSRRVISLWKYVAAAVLILSLLGGTAWFYTREKKLTPLYAYTNITSARQLIENVNTSKNTITIPLPDGSSVKLAANSRISYESKFDSMQTRDVYLSGQAFFNVKKDPHHPFRVFANEIVAKVLGTSFTVSSFEKDTVIRITVNTGKVSVYSQGQQQAVTATVTENKPAAIIVTPNQQVVYAKASQEFQKILLENPLMVTAVSVNKSMLYDDAPISKVFDDLGRDYGISIVYDNDLLKKCTVTADLANESFYRKLDLICRAMGAKYEVIDAQVVIQANGCQ